MPGVTPSKRAQTKPKSILQRPQGSQKKNMSPRARSPGQGVRFGRTSPPATPQRGNSSPATGKGAGKSPGGEQLVALSRARQAMGLVEKTMLNSEPDRPHGLRRRHTGGGTADRTAGVRHADTVRAH